jgi:translation initiation factor 4E
MFCIFTCACYIFFCLLCLFRIILKDKWTFWYMMRSNKSSVQANNYEHNIHPIGTFGDSDEFWTIYSHLRRPNVLPVNSDVHLFRDGVKPVWEDSVNAKGGKWIIRLKKGLINRLWEHLCLAVITGELGVLGEEEFEVCGVVVSIRYQEDILSIWSRTANDENIKKALKETIKKALQLPPSLTMEYKAHDAAMKDNSSFRNTSKQ